jgi:hypothetical protein
VASLLIHGHADHLRMPENNGAFTGHEYIAHRSQYRVFYAAHSILTGSVAWMEKP